ncbi:hypothetical protein [Salinibacter ruber]|uniref:Uncharacterized protein n=1 Tax=Salinibacter ruber TaxID=146919 RepID=A0A9X2Q5B9_9BACT|nr:hypothetical protein [Salinibacter ruber]MCS3661753.1 hypothetical protein [Salinibacter ruber]MCS3711586.1 hypothetical protein [Salinibacter ruber]
MQNIFPANTTHDPVFDSAREFAKWFRVEEKRVRREASADQDLENFSEGDTVPEGDVELTPGT